MAADLARQPGASIPKGAGSWSATMAAYRLLHNARVTPERLQHGAIEQARQSSAAAPVTLVLHDLTELQAAQVTVGTKLLQHTALAVDGGGASTIFGVLHQRWFEQPRTRPGETRRQRRARWTRSQVWSEAVAATGAPPEGSRWIAVADREADMFAMFEACDQAKQGFVIRSQHDRYLEGGGRLREHMTRQPIAGRVQVAVGRRSRIDKGPPKRWRKKQAARQASCVVRFAEVELSAPVADPRYTQPRRLYAVHVQEENPPAEVAQPLQWLLLTSEPVTSFEQAQTVIGWYRRRWLIEEYHKAQKSSCRVEQTQLEDRDAFVCFAALAGIVAARLLQLREQADDARTAQTPAMQQIDDPLWVQVVSRLARHDDPRTLTVDQFYRAIAKHGGWLGRKGDGRPGWQSLWHGFQLIAAYVQGARLMQDL